MTVHLERHALSAACGEMDPDEFMALQESLGRRGATRKILMYEGKVLDGWHLYQAGIGMEVPVEAEQFAGTHAEAEQFVWDMHGARRNWSKSQRAAVKAILLAQKSALGADADRQTITDAAAEAQVGKRTMEQAVTVVDKGHEAVVKAVVDGNISLKRAEQIVRDHPKPREQVKAMREPPAPRGTTITAPSKTGWRAAKAAIAPPQVGVSKGKADEMQERIDALMELNNELTARCAVNFMEGTEEEKGLAAATIAELQGEVKALSVKLEAVTASRDSAVKEANELKRQCAMYRNQLAKFGKKAA